MKTEKNEEESGIDANRCQCNYVYAKPIDDNIGWIEVNVYNGASHLVNSSTR